MEHISGKLKHSLILASGSPRRAQLLEEMGLTYEVRPKPIEEIFPEDLAPSAIAEYLAVQKANEFNALEIGESILITADTLVAHGNEILNKPANHEEAVNMILSLSGQKHEVITGVCLKSNEKQVTFHETTRVTFYNLTQEEVEFYVDCFKPFDKAGAYGIQEWVGHIGVEKIEGSYNNVVGLPTASLYQHLKQF